MGGEGSRVRTPWALGQKIPHWLTEITFLGEAETAVRSGIKSGFGMAGVPCCARGVRRA